MEIPSAPDMGTCMPHAELAETLRYGQKLFFMTVDYEELLHQWPKFAPGETAAG